MQSCLPGNDMKLAAGTWLFACLPLIATPALAETSIENQCRAAVRAEMEGPDCRLSNVRDNNPMVDPCGIPTASNQMMLYTEKVVQCVKRGGPGH